MSKTHKSRKAGKSRKSRKLSAFNIFMKQELERIKTETPEINHMVAFRQAAKNWKNHPKKGQPSQTRKGDRQTKNKKGKKGKPYKHHKGGYIGSYQAGVTNYQPPQSGVEQLADLVKHFQDRIWRRNQ